MSGCKLTSRRWLRFGVKELALLLLITAGLFAVLARSHRQRRTVDAIRRLGGRITYCFGNDSTAAIRDPTPYWLRGFLGELFVRVDEVNLSGCRVTDSDLDILATLKDLRVLSLRGTGITNRGLAVLSDLPRIQTIDLDETRVTSETLPLLQQLPHLERVSMLGLDLDSQDLSDPQEVTRKLQFVNRSNTVSDSRLLSTIAQSWHQRQSEIRSFSLACDGKPRRVLSRWRCLANNRLVRCTHSGAAYS